MLGQMMTQPLLISALIEHAARYHGDALSAECLPGFELPLADLFAILDESAQ